MNHILATTTGTFGQTVADLINTVAHRVATFGESIALHVQYRRTVKELSTLTSRELYDLGLEESNIRSEAMKAVYG